MNYDVLINDNEIYLYKNTDFNTINITMYFIAKNGNKYSAIYDLLCEYMLRANKKYSQSEIAKRTRELYGLEIEWDTALKNDKRLFFINLDLVAPSIIKDNYSKEAFLFAKEILSDISFDRKDILDNIKRLKLAEIEADLSDVDEQEECLYNSTVLPNKDKEYDYSLDIDYIKNLFDSITLEDLKQVYEETINDDNFYRCLVFGNITDEEYKEFRNIFSYNGKKKSIDYQNRVSIKEGINIIPCEETNESSIYITYSLDRIDKVTRDILYDILNGSSDLCLEIFRGKYSLVYEANATIACLGKYLYIYAKADKNNINKVIDAADELIKTIQNPKSLKELLLRAKDAIRKENYLLSENKKELLCELKEYVNEVFDRQSLIDYDKRLEDINEEDVAKVTNSLVKRNVFVYRGDAK